MDFEQIISFLQASLDSPTLDPDYALQCDTLAVKSLPQPSCSNQSLDLLKAFCSDEDTVKSYLLDGDELNNQQNQQLFDSSMETYDYCIENWLNFNDQIKQSQGVWTIENITPGPNHISSYITTDLLAVRSPVWSKINDIDFNMKLNFISLVKRGYKLTLSLLTDNSEVDEPWNPDVSQKILAVSFSSLSFKSEYLSNEIKLNGFESLLMTEALAAFKGQRLLNVFENLHDKRISRASPVKLISICNGIKGYKKIENSDKVILLCYSYYHLNMMEVIFNYDAEIDGWRSPESGEIFDRRDAFLFNQLLHDGLVYVIETFPDRLRNDLNAIILIYLIIIFNADISGLKYPEMIRHEQFSYIYLLRRYLRTICESDCEAADNHYRLMVKIEQIKLISEQTKDIFSALLKEPLVESITRAVTGQCTFQFHLEKTLDENYLLGSMTTFSYATLESQVSIDICIGIISSTHKLHFYPLLNDYRCISIKINTNIFNEFILCIDLVNLTTCKL